jgi:hypothetical protein
MTTTKSNFYRQAATQDDMNFKLSQRFLGKSNNTYQRLKGLTDVSDQVVADNRQDSLKRAKKKSLSPRKASVDQE